MVDSRWANFHLCKVHLDSGFNLRPLRTSWDIKGPLLLSLRLWWISCSSFFKFQDVAFHVVIYMGSRSPDFGMGGRGVPRNIISYDVKKYEIRTLSRSGDFSKINRIVY